MLWSFATPKNVPSWEQSFDGALWPGCLDTRMWSLSSGAQLIWFFSYLIGVRDMKISIFGWTGDQNQWCSSGFFLKPSQLSPSPQASPGVVQYLSPLFRDPEYRDVFDMVRGGINMHVYRVCLSEDKALYPKIYVVAIMLPIKRDVFVQPLLRYLKTHIDVYINIINIHMYA